MISKRRPKNTVPSFSKRLAQLQDMYWTCSFYRRMRHLLSAGPIRRRRERSHRPSAHYRISLYRRGPTCIGEEFGITDKDGFFHEFDGTKSRAIHHYSTIDLVPFFRVGR